MSMPDTPASWCQTTSRSEVILVSDSVEEKAQQSFSPIAIVGLSSLLPDAADVEQFWQNVMTSHVSFREVSPQRWSSEDFWCEGGPGDVPEGKTYSKIGAFVDGFEFDWRRWKQPPGTLSQIDESQLWAVAVAAAALEDAGYLGEGARLTLPNERCGVIFANALGGENRVLSSHRVYADEFTRKAVEAGLPAESADTFKSSIIDGRPHVDEDTMPGELANVVAGRVANLLDLQGPNFSADAACASTFAALVSACQMLQTGHTDVMLCGASDRTMDAGTYAKFSAIGALSATHSRPFDASANGFVMGEGAGCVVLKRLEDAISDGDEVYSVIRGIGSSSDGRGKGITAPSTRGQRQAVLRAYQQAGYSPTTVELIEAHGTSTRVGDATELATLAEIFADLPAGERVAVGSVKSQIGHLKAAAGLAGLLKTSLALHNRTIPPSAGFTDANTSVDWAENPFFVPTQPLDWTPATDHHPRRAGISAFGFGGTNFHVALEAYDPEFHLAFSQRNEVEEKSHSHHLSIFDATINPTMTHAQLKEVEGGVLLLSAAGISELAVAVQRAKEELFNNSSPNFDDDPCGRRLSMELTTASIGFEAKGARCAVVATSWAQLEKRIDLLLTNMTERSRWDFLAKQMVFITEEQPLPPEAKVVQMYPGQGSQYVGMTADLGKRFVVIGETWVEADETMQEILQGEKLSDFVLRDGLDARQAAVAEERLKQTEYTQPAMLTADLAIYRLLKEHGIQPDMVAGHSLGEYAALSVSGIMKFSDALRAAAARGTEMGSVDVPDKGVMASVTAPYEKVVEVIDSIEGYIIPANKNSPMMTVIAGETVPMQRAATRFQELGITFVTLQTSHAFHSRIVAPANEPLHRFLSGLELSLPDIPITANYDGEFYPDTLAPEQTVHQAVLAQLAPQMSSSVEWTEQIRNMYRAGGRLFIEVGPKRALALFAEQILEGRGKVVTNTNHPKVGGVASLLSALAVCALSGRIPQMLAADSSRLSAGFRAGPIEARESRMGSEKPKHTSAEWEELRLRARPLPHYGSLESEVERQPRPSNSRFAETAVGREAIEANLAETAVGREAIEAYLAETISDMTGYPPRHIHGELQLATLGITDEMRDSLIEEVQSKCRTSGPADNFTTLSELQEWVTSPPPRPMASSSKRANSPPLTNSSQATDSYVVSGLSLGLPGMDEVFSEDALERIIAGENFISELSDEMKQRLLDKNMVRIVKHPDGRAEFVPCDDFSTIPQLAGVGGYFDLAEQYGVDAKIVAAMDVCTRLAIAAGLEALRDAGLPLFPMEQVSSSGKRVVRGWKLPPSMRDDCGVIFASVFPGIAMAMRHALNNGADENGVFDRRFLLQVLTMGHAQFAQWVGARGPNMAINNACASTPAAFALAEDWLNSGRCQRVIIISGDDSSGDDMLEWVGAGFAAAGAHSMGNVVEEVALPFDARRNGMLLGMGGAAFVIEKRLDVLSRGVTPYAQLLGAELGNSAFHPTRLDVDHVADVFDGFVDRMESMWGVDRHEIAGRTTFMSHEPFTPPRGGSAAAEIESLRRTFGESAERLIITNTKGFTGHPMGVGIEDATGIFGLAAGRLPPIANFRQPDPSLGNLRLSEGGEYDVEYMLRHAAGFGSQIALTLFRREARTTNRIDCRAVHDWVVGQTGADVNLRILKRKLVAYLDADESLIGGVEGEVWSLPPADAGPSESAEKHSNVPSQGTNSSTKSSGVRGNNEPPEVLRRVESEPQEAPSAEETTTATAVNGAEPPSTSDPSTMAEQETDNSTAERTAGGGQDADEVEKQVVATVAEQTGYPVDFIELDQDLEGELGIDTVKQAEIMAELRTIFSLPVDESFQLREHPTLNHMVSYIIAMSGGSEESVPTTEGEDGVPTAEGEEGVPTAEGEESVPTGEGEESVPTAEGEEGVPTTESEEGVPTAEGEESVPTTEGEDGVPTGKSNESVKEEGEPSSAVDSAVVTREVLRIVVSHTGYPEDFLELDQDLEGELGIDTVKQAEIMADCRSQFSLPVDESFQLRDYPTLAHMISYITSFSSALGDGSQQLTETISEEVSLSTDSVVLSSKEQIASATEVARTEATGAMEENPMATGANEANLEASEDDSHDVAESIVAQEGVSRDSGAEVAPEDDSVNTVRRWVVEVEEASEGDSHPVQMDGEYLLVTDDSWGLGEAICQNLEDDGVEAIRVIFDPKHKGSVKMELEGEVDVIHLNPSDEGQLSQLEGVLAPLSIAGVIHTAPCTLAGMAWAEVTSRRQTQMVCHGLFGILKAIDGKLSQRKDGIVASVSALDGRHGNGGHRFNALGAGAHGIVKSYARERENIRARAIDVAPELLVDAESLAAVILTELAQMGPREVGIDTDGRRWQVCIYDEAHENETQSLESEDVIIVSGGGSGVTAACVVALSEENRGIGVHFALLGRTELDESLAHLADASEDELAQAKLELREAMQSESASGKVTIVEWEKAWARQMRSVDILKTIGAVRKGGNSASYHACDITESSRVRAVVKDLRKQQGPVTGIIHGAGIEDSKLVADKTMQTFSTIISVKVDGWQSLFNAVKDNGGNLKFCCAFTSIAGRFGNGGQTDYAAANCILDAEMSRLAHTTSEARAIAIAWTGWEDVGMATRGSIQKVFQEAGIETVSVKQGTSMFVDEVMRGGKRRVVVAGSLGLLDDDGSEREPPQRLPADVTALLAAADRFPFIDKIVAHSPFDSLAYECTLDRQRFPFLNDHAINGVPYHPGVMALEMFAEAAQILWPPCSVIGFAGARFGLPVKLVGPEVKVRVVAQFSHQNDDNVWVKCSLESDLVNRKGEVFGEPRIHHKALVRLLKKGAERGGMRLPSVGMPSEKRVIHGSDFIYSRFFHGPRFQSHGGIIGGADIDGCFAIDGVALTRQQLPDSNLFTDSPVQLESLPMLIEASFQNAGMLAMEIDGLESLPVGIEQVELIRQPERGERLLLRSVRRRSEDDGVTLHDCLVVNQDRRPIIALNGLRLKGMAPISEDKSFTIERN